MSRSRDEWLARQVDAARIVPRPVISRTIATRRLLGGWDVTVRGQNLVPLGVPGNVEVGGQQLEDVTFSPTEIAGRLRAMPRAKEVTVDLGVIRVPAGPLRVAPRQAPRLEDATVWIAVRLRRLLDDYLSEKHPRNHS
jgi:hypothetical protein